MKLLLADVLRCPRCGPEWGLILLADRVDEERRVEQGRLGCANCRSEYPIEGGVLDLRLDRAVSPGAGPAPPPLVDEGAAVRLAALLGLSAGGGRVALRGFAAPVAAGIASLVPEVEVIELRAEASGDPARRGVQQMLSGGGYSFADRSLRGVALQASADGQELADAVRVVVAGGRLVVAGGGSGVEAALRSLGAEILLSEGEMVVGRKGVASPPTAG